MHPKIRSFFSKRQNMLRVSNQAVVVGKGKIQIVGIGFYYEVEVDSNINPPVYLPLDKYLSTIAITGSPEKVELVTPKKLIIESRVGKLALPKLAVDAVVHNFLDGEFVDFSDDFIQKLRVVYSVFTPHTIYFVNHDTVLLMDEYKIFFATLKMEVPFDVRGMSGVISDNMVFIPGATVTWKFTAERNWQLICSQEIDNEKLDIVFSALKPADISVFGSILNIFDSIEIVGSVVPTKEVIRAIHAATSSGNCEVFQEDSDLVLSAADAEIRLYGVAEGEVFSPLIWKELLTAPKATFTGKIYFGVYDDRKLSLIKTDDESIKIIKL